MQSPCARYEKSAEKRGRRGLLDQLGLEPAAEDRTGMGLSLTAKACWVPCLVSSTVCKRCCGGKDEHTTAKPGEEEEEEEGDEEETAGGETEEGGDDDEKVSTTTEEAETA